MQYLTAITDGIYLGATSSLLHMVGAGMIAIWAGFKVRNILF